ncbi:ATP-binding protein [Azohydromonas aeria]|uniref:ATP-binding protein n=1 Tax=Azohydromonas aeria TaxID=2590212 RepID=UPI0012FB3D55|nr:ferredoxin family protein [Azohydromonas aeria]
MPTPDEPGSRAAPSRDGAARSRPARAPLPDIDAARCTGCGRCIAACPVHVLSFHTVRWTKFAVLVEADPCTGCSLCERRCPFNAITMRPAAQVRPHGG